MRMQRSTAPEKPDVSVERVPSADAGAKVPDGVEVTKSDGVVHRVFAVQDVRHRGRILAKAGDELTDKLETARSQLAYAERRADRSDIAAYGWTGAIIDANSKIAKIEAAIVLAEQQESG